MYENSCRHPWWKLTAHLGFKNKTKHKVEINRAALQMCTNPKSGGRLEQFRTDCHIISKEQTVLIHCPFQIFCEPMVLICCFILCKE